MTDLLVDLSERIITSNIIDSVANNIFQDYIPDNPDFIVTISEYAGLPQALAVDAGVRSIQIKVRDISAASAKQKCWMIYNLFNNVNDPIQFINNGRWVICRPRQTPFKISTDDRDRVTWCFNMGVTTNNEF